MTERSYQTIDKSGWGVGPWQDEPDKLQWIDGATDLDCLLVRNAMGALCGYVGLPQSHPLFGVGYSQCSRGCDDSWCDHTPESMFVVHGGITFSDACQDTGNEAEGVCHLPFDGRPEQVWWFGFDCAHSYDLLPGYAARFGTASRGLFRSDVYRDVEYVRSECAKLARQLAGVGR